MSQLGRMMLLSVTLVAAVALAEGDASARRGPGGGGGPGRGPGPGMGHGRGHGMGMGGGMGMGMGMGPKAIERLGKELGLSAKQQQSIRDIADATRKKNIQVRADLQSLEIDLRRELDRDEPDAAKAAQLIDRIGALEVQLHKNRIAALIDVKKVLTKEQRAKLAELRATRGPGGWGDDDDAPGRGPGPGRGRGQGGAGPGPGPGAGAGPR